MSVPPLFIFEVNNNHMQRNFITFCFVVLLLILHPIVYAAKDKDSNKITPTELQSQIMSFADRLLGLVGGSTNEFILQNPTITPVERMLLNGKKLEVSAAAVIIAAGVNPEVSLLDMIVLVSLLKYSVEVEILPILSGVNGDILLDTYQKLEKDIWFIAEEALSQKQQVELRELIKQWKITQQKSNKKTIGIAYYRFSAFAKNRRLSTLQDKGEPGWFLAKVSTATKELERTRVLAERVVFAAARQPILLRWEAEQIFYELAVTPEFTGMLGSATDIGRGLQSLAIALENTQKMISTESETVIQVFMRELKNERQAAIEQASDRFAIKAFYVGSMLIIVFMLSALLTMLAYKYYSQKLNTTNKI